MPEIASLVFFDIETTGLPFQENNQTKIIEFSFVAVLRKQLELTPYGFSPPVRKLTFLLNPQRPVSAEVTKMTGLSIRDLTTAPTFQDKAKDIINFLEELPSPVCLVAHNGNTFDFKILLAEFNDASACPPAHLFCVDSLMGFRRILSGSDINHLNLVDPIPNIEDLLTDDEDEAEWPDLNVSMEEWDAIDKISNLSLSSESEAENIDQDIVSKMTEKRSEAIKKVFRKDPNRSKDKECFKLTAVYKRLMNKEEDNAHRAEFDCLMLLQCVVALKKEFLPWIDNNSKLLTDIKPLIRRSSAFPNRFNKRFSE